MKQLETVRWGFIGCGAATETKSGPAFSSVPGSEVVAVMSRKAEKAESYATRHQVPRWYTDVQSLIDDPEVNAIYIATPPSSHATYALMAMRAGKPVYIEKPMAASYADCIRINRISQQTGVPCFVAYYRRYLPYFRKVKEIIDSQMLGKLLSCQISFAVPPRELDYSSANLPWRLQPDIAGRGGYFYDLAPHQIDLLQYMIKGRIIETQGYCSNMAGLYKVEDTINACFKFDNGMTGSASWCFVAHESARTDRIQIVGLNGSISFSVFDYKPIELYTENGYQTFSIDNPRHVQQPLIQRVVEHLQGKSICECNGIEATPVNWVMDKILGIFDID
jgi:predicted dehydrogenase